MTNSRPLVYTRRKKGLRSKSHAATDAQDKEPSFDEAASIKRTEALGPLQSRNKKHQKSGVTDGQDNGTSSTCPRRESKKRRKLEVVRSSSQATSLTDDDDVVAIGGSELRRLDSMSAEIQSQETSCHITVDYRSQHQDGGIIIDDEDIPLARLFAAGKSRRRKRVLSFPYRPLMQCKVDVSCRWEKARSFNPRFGYN